LIDRYFSNCTNLRMEICWKKLGSSRPSFQGHKRSLELTRISHVFLTIYSRSIATVGLSSVPFPRYCEISAENCDFLHL